MTVTNPDFLYDDTEASDTRFVGFVGESGQLDLALLRTAHFFGKSLVICLQTNRCAILTAEEAEDEAYIARAFAVSEQEAAEMSAFLVGNL
ncbi:MAG: DUF3055 domain-containing protein [Firmicutes bacterium]|nr:DUF3055 domain-containing protein [Bacillota bacterium]